MQILRFFKPTEEEAVMRALYLLVLPIALLLGSCSTMKRTLMTGAITGATTGTFAGAVVAKKDKKEASVKGALIGGILGLGLSWFAHKRLEKRDHKTRRELLLNLERFGVGEPKAKGKAGPVLSSPVVDSEWVETKVEDNKLIEGHRVWVIKENPQWVPNQKGGEK